MRVRCRGCGKFASTKRACRTCGLSWPTVHCHNTKHLSHVDTYVEVSDGTSRYAYWPLDYDGRPLPLEVDGAPNPDLTPCAHAHPHDGFVHLNEPHHEVQEEQKV